MARPEGVATGDGLAASRTEGAEEAWATTRPTAPAAAATSPAPSIAADSSRACPAHTAEAQPATQGREERPATRGREERPAIRGRRAGRGPDRRRDTHKLIVAARIRPQDGSVAAAHGGTGTGTAWPAATVAATGSATPTAVTTSQVGPHQSASTSQTGGSGWDVIAGMGQQSTPAGPASTETTGCVPGTTIRNGNLSGN